MDCDWQSATYPDGRIVQRYHIKHASYINFPPEEDNVNATHPGGRGVTATLPLAAAMPNAVFEVRVQVVRATKAEQSSTYNNEAAELAAAWNLRRQGSEKDKVYIDIARARGSEHEHIDIWFTWRATDASVRRPSENGGGLRQIRRHCADQLINAVLGGRLKPCPSAPTASACWMAGQVGGASFGSSTHCFGGRKTIAGARMPPPSTDAHTKIKTLPTYGRAESTNDKTAARRC